MQRRKSAEPTVLRPNGMFWLPRWVSLGFVWDSQEDSCWISNPYLLWRFLASGKNCTFGARWHFWFSSRFSVLILQGCNIMSTLQDRTCRMNPDEHAAESMGWTPRGIGMFEAMRLSTHVLSSPCTITRSEAWCPAETSSVEALSNKMSWQVLGLRVLKCQSGSRAPTVVFLHRMVSDKSWFWRRHASSE